MLEDQLVENLQSLAKQGLQRRRPLLETPCGTRCRIDGKDYLSFASNDYLGFAQHPKIIESLCQGARRWGAGSGASHLVSGHLQAHEALESALANFVGFPATLAFSTGYLANLAILPALAGRGDAIFSDKLNHASLIDAVQLSRANSFRYPHGDLLTLARQLKASHDAGTKVIVTDAVFSMDGDIAPLPALLALAETHDAWLVIDDAHGFGVLGPQGQGSLAHLGVRYHPRLLLMGTLGKAAGVSGAFVAGSETAINWLVQSARSYIFTTASSPAIACALITSLELIAKAGDLRAHLRSLMAHLRRATETLPWRLLESETAIQPLIVGENQAALDLAGFLRSQGIWVPAIRPPTVPKGAARLRISLSAAHTHDDIDLLTHALRKAQP